MNFKQTYLASLIALLGFVTVACDDNTDTLGGDMMPGSDLVSKEKRLYDVTTQSYAVGDSVLARSTISYFGQFTDPETGTVIKSDFLAQFYCSENFGFPDSIVHDSIESIDLSLVVNGFVGDTLAPFKLSVYALDKVLDPNQDYYTNIDPGKYYDKASKPVAVKWFTLSDRSIADEDRWSKKYQRNIHITLPREMGQAIYDRFQSSPETFKSSVTFHNSGLPGSKGFYFKLESGDGAMAYISTAYMSLNYRYYDSEFAKDTTAVSRFSSTEEVVQATRFENFNLEKLLSDTTSTYIKSPAGIFTLATLPAEELNYHDTINVASLSLVRYNDKVQSRFKLSIPQSLLMVRLDDYLNGYFERYQICDNRTSYLAKFNAGNNSYEFSNISRLLRVMIDEKKQGRATANYDKVLLIPVVATYDSSNNLVKICHDFSMASSRLKGGSKDRLKLEVIYSKYNQ